MSDSDDVRGGERHTASLRIRLKFDNEAHFIERYSANISRGGIFVATRTPKAVGTWLRFEFQLEGGQTVIRGEGSVAWISRFDPAQPDKPYGMGVRFDTLDDASKKVIERALTWKAARRRAVEAAARQQKREGPSEEATRRVDLDDLLKLSRRSALDDEAGVTAGAPDPDEFGQADALPVEAVPPGSGAQPPAEERTRVAPVPGEVLAAGGAATSSAPSIERPVAPPVPMPVESATTGGAAEAAAAPSAATEAHAPDPERGKAVVEEGADDESDPDAEPRAVVELEAEPADAEEDLPPLPLSLPAPTVPRAAPRRLGVHSPDEEPREQEAATTEGTSSEPQPLPPPPLEEVVPRPAAARTALGRIALLRGGAARRPAVPGAAGATREPGPSRRRQAPGIGAARSPVEELEELVRELGLDEQQLAEVTAQARTRTAQLVDKLSGEAGELDWLLDPPRPEPLPTPSQARALLDRWLSVRSGRG